MTNVNKIFVLLLIAKKAKKAKFHRQKILSLCYT